MKRGITMDSAINLKLTKAFASFVRRGEEKISVTALCDKADISRASFYLYHKDIEDLKEKLRKQCVQKLCEQTRLVMESDYEQLGELLRKENLNFTEDEIVLLEYFTAADRFFVFGLECNNIIHQSYVCDICSRYGSGIYEKNKVRFDLFVNGLVAMLLWDITKYNEEVLLSDMRNCRACFKQIVELAEK